MRHHGNPDPVPAGGSTALLTTSSPDPLDSLDIEERAQLLPAFLGVATAAASLRYMPRSRDGSSPAWVFDEESGMVYVLD